MFKKLLIIFGILLLILASLIALFKYYPEPEIKVPELTDISKLDDFIKQVVEDNGLPSLAVALLDSNGVQHLSVYGKRNIRGNTPVTKQDLYHLGSNTKAMTSVLTAMLIDDGLLTWETTIIEILPELSDQIHTDYHNVTIHELLTHTSGIKANYSLLHQLLDLDIVQRRIKIIEKSLKEIPQQQRGEYLYSNLAYITAGAMLERITNTSWEILMKERLFATLTMESADFGVPGSIGKEDQPWGHVKPTGLFGFVEIQRDNPKALGPAGTVHCTMEDWAKFISLQLMERDTTLLSEAQRIKLLSPIQNNYACGWLVVEPKWADGIVYTHAGSNTFNFSSSWTIPEQNIAILINSNANSKNIRQLFQAVRNEILEFY